MGICCEAQETQTGALCQPRGVGWGGRREGAPEGRGCVNLDWLVHDFLCTLDSTCAQDGECEAEFSPDGFEEKPEKEKKQTNFTLCSVCNIQLNSTAQAQIHYNGKSHQKRLKQLSNGMVKNDNVVTMKGFSAFLAIRRYTNVWTRHSGKVLEAK
ncbi:hypothetical protein FD754_014044 [Muntiacus muntjak]|uniref:U1-type domain-containing protein n=1 Tax=Muntiacus muntjak TaxID=9888 RepID=A0A5N3VIQ5_MUNMU|nr:hypothetical protein FD754_014044 [Muntiacus muntjak]